MLGLVFVLVYLFIPGISTGWLGVSLKDEFAYRIVSAAVLAFTVSSWYCYKVANWEYCKPSKLWKIMLMLPSRLMGEPSLAVRIMACSSSRMLPARKDH